MTERNNPERDHAPDKLGYATQIPVTFVMARVPASGVNRWSEPTWRIDSVVAAGQPGRPSREPGLDQGDGIDRWIWKGFSVHLYEDGGESYWYNLMSDEPRVFFICESADDDPGFEDDEPVPVSVTVSQDEAMGHLETDALVLSFVMPPEVAVNVERLVVATYEPVMKKKRRRRNWSDEALEGGPRRAGN